VGEDFGKTCERPTRGLPDLGPTTVRTRCARKAAHFRMCHGRPTQTCTPPVAESQRCCQKHGSLTRARGHSDGTCGPEDKRGRRTSHHHRCDGHSPATSTRTIRGRLHACAGRRPLEHSCPSDEGPAGVQAGRESADGGPATHHPGGRPASRRNNALRTQRAASRGNDLRRPLPMALHQVSIMMTFRRPSPSANRDGNSPQIQR
jgi:hypothetical protein